MRWPRLRPLRRLGRGLRLLAGDVLTGQVVRAWWWKWAWLMLCRRGRCWIRLHHAWYAGALYFDRGCWRCDLTEGEPQWREESTAALVAALRAAR